MHDILIRGGLLYDGTGGAGVAGDRRHQGRRDQRPSARALPSLQRKTIDATGLAVAPGFIDIKTHSDFTLPINPKAESKVRQGVTTEIIGHCGFSVAPALPGKVELLKRLSLARARRGCRSARLSFPDYLDTFPATAVNAGMLVGHNTLRLMVMGMANRAPSAGRARRHDRAAGGRPARRRARHVVRPVHAARLLRPAGRDGIAFGHVLKRHNAGYFTHLRDESNKVLEAVQEAIDIADKCGVHVEIVHFKCSGMDNWGKAAQALRDDRRRQGAQASTSIAIPIPTPPAPIR